MPAIRCGTGTDVFTITLARELRRRGLRCEITWLPHRAEYLPWSVRAHAPPPWANVVHINSWLHGRFVPRDLPCVATVHLPLHRPTDRQDMGLLQRLYHLAWIRRLEKANLRRADAIVAVSRDTADAIASAGTPSDVLVVYNGIDLSGPLHPVPRSMPNRPFRLLYVGSLSRRKGADLLPAIMDRLGSGFELLYTAPARGRPPPLPRNCRAVPRTGSPDELAELYRSADALLFPSRREGAPLAVLEAMACGLPVIAANASSLPEIVEHGACGLLCAPDDPDSFAQAARQLASSPALWRMMRQAARSTVERRFSLRQVIDAYLSIYELTLGTADHAEQSRRGQTFVPRSESQNTGQ